MTELMERIKKHFQSNELPFVPAEGQNAIVTVYGSDYGTFKVYIKDYHPVPVLMIYAQSPYLVPEEKKLLVSELVHKINKGLKVGAMEFEYEDGSVHTKTSVEYSAIKEYDDKLFISLFAIAVNALEKNLPDILRAINLEGANQKEWSQFKQAGAAKYLTIDYSNN